MRSYRVNSAIPQEERGSDRDQRKLNAGMLQINSMANENNNVPAGAAGRRPQNGAAQKG